MSLVSTITDFLLMKRNKTGIPDSLKKVVDRYDTAAVITTYDAENPVILYANKKHKTLTGYTNDEVIGYVPRKFQGKNTSDSVKRDIRKELKKSSFWHGNTINYKKNGVETEIQLFIFAICFEGEKYYVSLKKLVGEK
jgi:PAS domain S-box-containing protein